MRAKNLLFALATLLVLPAASWAGCEHHWQICGTATSAGQISVQFVVGQCTVTATANVQNGNSAQATCNALKNSIGTSCNCTLICAQSTVDPACWNLGDSPSCSNCDIGDGTGCCGQELRGSEPEW